VAIRFHNHNKWLYIALFFLSNAIKGRMCLFYLNPLLGKAKNHFLTYSWLCLKRIKKTTNEGLPLRRTYSSRVKFFHNLLQAKRNSMTQGCHLAFLKLLTQKNWFGYLAIFWILFIILPFLFLKLRMVIKSILDQ